MLFRSVFLNDRMFKCLVVVVVENEISDSNVFKLNDGYSYAPYISCSEMSHVPQKGASYIILYRNT